MSPWWYFVPFLLVPILIHLFDFRKARKVYFSSIKYIVSLTSKTKSKSRLRYFLILSNRLLIFAALLALIWILLDYLKNNEVTKGATVTYYDNSISSRLNNNDFIIENGLNQLSHQVPSILYLDNLNKFLLDKKTLFSIPDEVSFHGMNLPRLFGRLNKSGRSSQYLFADYQSVDLPNLKEYLSDSTKEYHLVLTTDLNEIRNVSVDSLYLLPNEENISELSILVDLNVINMSRGNIVVKLMQGTKQLSSVVKDVTELDMIRFDISKETYGNFEIVIDGDDVNFDNVFHFTINEKIKSKITILSSKVSKILKEVYKNEAFFEVSYQDIKNLDYEILKESDLIVISDQYKLPKGLQDYLKDIDFIIFPADSIDIKSYSDFMNISMSPLSETPSEIMIDTEHPLLKGIFEKKIGAETMPTIAPLFQINGDLEPIIKFRGGNPFLLKKAQSYLFNSKIDVSSDGFQSNALFLPILYQIAFSSSNTIETPYYFSRDKVVISAKSSDVPVKIKNANHEMIPSFNSNGSQIILEIPISLAPEKYVLIQGNDTLQTIAVNIPKAESIMKNPSLEEMKKSFSDMENVHVWEIVDGGYNVLFTKGGQSSLWKYVLILIVFLLFTETALHRYLK